MERCMKCGKKFTSIYFWSIHLAKCEADENVHNTEATQKEKVCG